MKDKPVILIVDDQPQGIELLEAHLVPQGYEIVKAASGEEALEKLSSNQIELILLDVLMPGMDGFEVTRRIRQETAHRLIPIILITALQETEDRVKGIEAGCDDFLSKPLDKMELFARVRSLLQVKAYNDLMRDYKIELEAMVTSRTEELRQALENLQQEITERKRVEEELKSNYALLQIAGETAIFGGWSVDLENNICTWSDAVADIHDMPSGYAPPVQEAINFYAPEWREKITEVFTACAKEGSPYDEDMEIITHKEKRVWVRAIGRAVRNEEGKIIKVQGSLQDITERKLLEDLLKESEVRYRRLFETASDGILLLEKREGNISLANPATTKLLGYSEDEITGKDFKDVGFPDDFETIQEILQTLEKDGIIHYKDTPLKKKNGQFVDTDVYMVDKAILVQCNIRDITERKRKEEENQKLQAQLFQAQKMESVGRLAGGVAHDFNNKLTVINGYAELAIDMMDPSDPLRETIQEIHTAGKQSADIVHHLLAFARQQTIRPVQLDLNDTISSMMKMLQRLIGENIDLAWHPGSNLWPVKIDPSQVDQVMTNLAVNSRDAISDVGKLIIETKNVVLDEDYCKTYEYFVPGRYVMLAVNDDGCGMEKAVQDNLFEPFFTTKEIGKGTGLGLPMVYGIVKQNKGFINVYSEPGIGTTFKIYLPRYETDEVSDMPTNTSTEKMPTGSETILVVEDEPAILKLGRGMLERLGYTVLTAENASDALQAALEYDGTIDLLITDVVMPEMNGRDLSFQLVKNHPGLKTLFMSGYTANVIAHHGVLDEGVQFIQKPFSLKDLAAKVREAIEQE
ncbi:MAG: response regulator [Desulfovermiculus sp.]|nr:response regulator [Desulfovermiculus sp.]